MDFPRSSQYDLAWIARNQMGFNPLVLTEWSLANCPPDESMRVLDLASGKALTSIFLAREFGCRVYSGDLWVDPTENLARMIEYRVDDLVTPLKLSARDLPFPAGYFDLIICTDAFNYFGTDDLYIPYIQKYLRQYGQLVFTVPGYMGEEPEKLPGYLERFWDDDCWAWHNREWWKRRLEKSGYFNVSECERFADTTDFWVEWNNLLKEQGAGYSKIDTDTDVLREDGGRNLGFIKVVARKR